jgi:outer membrane protein assembly factor BamB
VYFGGVTFADGQVLVATADGYTSRSLDPLTGRVVWTGYEPQQWAPTVIDGVAVSWSTLDGHVSARPVAQCAGKPACPAAWTVTLPNAVDSVAGANGVLVVDVRQHGLSPSYLQAIDLRSGRLLWTATNPDGGGGILSTAGSLLYTSPAISRKTRR